jgi:hypothetical protein
MRRPSLTTDTLLLNTGVLHRVDTRQMPADAGVAFGAMCTQSTPQPAAKHKGRFAGIAEALAQPVAQKEPSAYDLQGMDYSDHHGPVPKVDPALRATFWRCYLGTLAVGLLALAAWLWA